MIVYNLVCDREHTFEGWFGSPADFENQRDRGLVACPVCGRTAVERRLHAPRLNVGATEAPAAERLAALSEQAAQGTLEPEALRNLLREVGAEIRARTEDVGERFADEARAMHYGEKAQRDIRGRTSAEEAEALREEGIEFGVFPFPLDPPELH